MIVNEGGGVRLPNLTNPAVASDLLVNKQLIDSDGNIVNGTMPIVTHPNPSIIVGANGLIVASHEQETGKVTGGITQATHQLTVRNGTTITPGTSQKTAVASGCYTTGPIYVAGDANLKAANIKSGVSIFGVNGTYNPGSGYTIKTVTGTYVPQAVSENVNATATSFSEDSPIKGLLGFELKAPKEVLSGSLNTWYFDSDDYLTAWLFGLSVNGPKTTIDVSGFVANYDGSEWGYKAIGYQGVPDFSLTATIVNSYETNYYIDLDVNGSGFLANAGRTVAPSGYQYKVIYAV